MSQAEQALLAIIHNQLLISQNISTFDSQYISHLEQLATTMTTSIHQLGSAQMQAASLQANLAHASPSRRSSNTPSFNIDLPRFDGSGDYLAFEKRLRIVLLAKHCLETADGLAWTYTALDGLAAQYAENLDSENLEELLAGLRSRFVPENEGFRLRNKLLAMRQIGRNFDSYTRHFNETLSRIPDMCDEDAKWAFTRGLPAHSQNEIHYRNAANLSEAQDIARKIHYAYRMDNSQYSQDDHKQINTSRTNRSSSRYSHHSRSPSLSRNAVTPHPPMDAHQCKILLAAQS